MKTSTGSLCLVLLAVMLCWHSTSADLCQQLQQGHKGWLANKTEFIDNNGKSVNIKNWRGQNIILYFWAPWLPECIHDMRRLNELSKTIFEEEEGLKIIPIMVTSAIKSTQDFYGKATTFYTNHNIDTLPTYLDTAGKYHAIMQAEEPKLTLPLTILIDKFGKEVGRTDQPIKEHMTASPRTLKELNICFAP